MESYLFGFELTDDGFCHIRKNQLGKSELSFSHVRKCCDYSIKHICILLKFSDIRKTESTN